MPRYRVTFYRAVARCVVDAETRAAAIQKAHRVPLTILSAMEIIPEVEQPDGTWKFAYENEQPKKREE